MYDLNYGTNPFLDNDQWLLIIEITQVSVIWYGNGHLTTQAISKYTA